MSGYQPPQQPQPQPPGPLDQNMDPRVRNMLNQGGNQASTPDNPLEGTINAFIKAVGENNNPRYVRQCVTNHFEGNKSYNKAEKERILAELMEYLKIEGQDSVLKKHACGDELSADELVQLNKRLKNLMVILWGSMDPNLQDTLTANKEVVFGYLSKDALVKAILHKVKLSNKEDVVEGCFNVTCPKTMNSSAQDINASAVHFLNWLKSGCLGEVPGMLLKTCRDRMNTLLNKPEVFKEILGLNDDEINALKNCKSFEINGKGGQFRFKFELRDELNREKKNEALFYLKSFAAEKMQKVFQSSKLGPSLIDISQYKLPGTEKEHAPPGYTMQNKTNEGVTMSQGRKDQGVEAKSVGNLFQKKATTTPPSAPPAVASAPAASAVPPGPR